MKPSYVVVILAVIAAALWMTLSAAAPLKQVTHITTYDTVRVLVDPNGKTIHWKSEQAYMDEMCEADYQEANTQRERERAIHGRGPRIKHFNGTCLLSGGHATYDP